MRDNPFNGVTDIMQLLSKRDSMLQERLKHEEAVEANNGVWWKDRLRVVPIDEAAAVQKGIKRGADKVITLTTHPCIVIFPHIHAVKVHIIAICCHLHAISSLVALFNRTACGSGAAAPFSGS